MCKTKDCKVCGKTFEKFKGASKLCLDCKATKNDKQRFCKSCDCPLPRTQGPKKYCKACAIQAVKLRTQRESIESAIGKTCSVRFIECIECRELYTAPSNYKRKIDACSAECRSKAYSRTAKESSRWLQYPFQFKLSDCAVAVRSGLRRVPSKANVGFCCFCGSAKVMGDAVQRKLKKGGRFFCDEECACQWKSICYRSEQYEHNERLRARGEARRAKAKAEIEQRANDRLAKRLARPINKKTPGYVTCTVCHKTVWVEQHSQKQFCSNQCRKKSSKAKLYNKNRRHKIRSKSLSQLICLDALMKRHRNRCKQCNTLCVKPEGYNHPNEGTIDHIMPLSKGGLHLWNNVQLLCRQCNSVKRDIVLPGTQMMLRFDQ